MAVHPNAAACELVELARRKCSANRSELLAELGPENGKVWSHPYLERIDRAELDILDAQLVTDLLSVGLRRLGPLHDHSP